MSRLLVSKNAILCKYDVIGEIASTEPIGEVASTEPIGKIVSKELIEEVVSTESLEEVASFKDLQVNLSKKLSYQREELCEMMTTNITENSQIKNELSDLSRSIRATGQRVSKVERKCSTAKNNLNAADKDLQDAEDAVSRKQRDVEKARNTRVEAIAWTIIGGGYLTLFTFGIAAPLAVTATILVDKFFSDDLECEKSSRDDALAERNSCVNRLSQAKAQLNILQDEENKLYRQKHRLEEKNDRLSEALKAIENNVKKIGSTLAKVNLEVICQKRVKLNAQSLEETMFYEARMKHLVNIESIEASYRELERRANEMNYVTTCNQIDLKTHLKKLNESLDRFHLAIANTENMKLVFDRKNFLERRHIKNISNVCNNHFDVNPTLIYKQIHL